MRKFKRIKTLIVCVAIIAAMLLGGCASETAVDTSSKAANDITSTSVSDTSIEASIEASDDSADTSETSVEASDGVSDENSDNENSADVSGGSESGEYTEYGEKALKLIRSASITYQTRLLNSPIEYAIEKLEGYELKELKIKCDRNVNPDVNASVFEMLDPDEKKLNAMLLTLFGKKRDKRIYTADLILTERTSFLPSYVTHIIFPKTICHNFALQRKMC